jgi:hypothetical protein
VELSLRLQIHTYSAVFNKTSDKWDLMALTMVYDTESLGLWTFPTVRNSKQLENTTFTKLYLFTSSGFGSETLF